MNDTARTLRAAAGLIERDGWCQGAFRDQKGRRCVDGALDEAARGTLTYGPARRALEATIGTWQIAGWNDYSKRRKSQVVAALRKAAELAEAEA